MDESEHHMAGSSNIIIETAKIRVEWGVFASRAGPNLSVCRPWAYERLLPTPPTHKPDHTDLLINNKT